MRLPVQEVLSDFDAITGIGSKWREQGITPREIRSFCVWRQAPMFYVDCQGRLLDKFEPAIKEQRAVAFGHAFFYKSARTVARCEPIGDRAQAKYRGERKPGETPEDLEQVRRELLAEGHCPKVVMRSMSECLRLRVRGGEDCVICAFHEELEVLQAWMGRLGLPYRGQRLAGAASEVDLPSPPQSAPGSAQVSAGRARGAGPPVQALRGAHHRGDMRAGPHRPRAPVLLRTGPEPPGPVPRVPPKQNGSGVLARHDAGVPGLRGLRGIAPAAPAGLQAQQPQAGADLPRNRRGPRTPWPTVSSRHPSSAPRTTWSKPARGTWRT